MDNPLVDWKTLTMTIIGKNRQNRRRCEGCGHPVRKGKPCRITGLDSADCFSKRNLVLPVIKLAKALRRDQS